MLKLKRLCPAIVLAFPLVWLATAIGDNPSTPGLVRIATSPGMAVAIHLPMCGQRGWLDAVAQIGMTALALNLLYYVLIMYAILTWIRWFLNPKPARS